MAHFLTLSRTVFLLLVKFCCLANLSFSQTGPGGVGQANGNDRLELWLDAGQAVTGDTSGNGAEIGWIIKELSEKSGKAKSIRLSENNANTIVFPNSKQANGLNRIGFNRNSLNNAASGLIIDSIVKTSDYTIYLVIEPVASQNKQEKQTILELVEVTDSIKLPGSVNAFSLNLSGNQLNWSTNLSSENQNSVVAIPTPLRTCIVRLGSYGLNNMFEIASSDGRLKYSKSPKQFTTGYFNLFLGFDGTSFPYKGYLSSIIIYSRMLSLAERTMVENSLSAQYYIPLSMNDIFTNDNTENGDYDSDMAGIGKAADGSSVLDARGEGIIEIRNASHLSNNEYLSWGRSRLNLSLTDSTDVPSGVSYRLSSSWRCTEIGEVGKVDVLVDTIAFKIPQIFKLVMLIDRNNNGLFIDDTILTFQQGNLNKQRILSQIQLNNGDRFTLGVIRDFGQLTSGLMTPNGDGADDTYYVQRRGMVRILNQNGNLVRELKAPAPWDGKNNDGQLVSPGTYILEINRQERINVSVRY